MITLEIARKIVVGLDVGKVDTKLACKIVALTQAERVIEEMVSDAGSDPREIIHSLAHLIIEGIMIGYNFKCKEMELAELEKLK